MIEEVHELEDTIRQLELKSELSEDRLRDLQHTRLALEKEINTKRNTISYDRGQFKSFCKVWPRLNRIKTKKPQHESFYSKLSIIRPGQSSLLEFEKKIVLVV